MNQIVWNQLAGWAAVIHAVATFTSFSALILFFIVGGFWGGLNDALSVIWALSLIPILLFFYHHVRVQNMPFSMIATGIGIVSLLVFAVLQFLLVVGMVKYEQTVQAVLSMYGLFGICLVILGSVAFGSRLFPSGLLWTMLIFGFGLFLSMVGFWIGREQNPLAAAGFALAFLADMVWSIWLVRILLITKTLPA